MHRVIGLHTKVIVKMSLIIRNMIELLERQTDPRSKRFAFIDGSPFKFYAWVCVLMLLLKSVFLFKNNIDLRPYKLILNGFIFGCYFVGLLFAIWLSDGARTFSDCSPLNPNTTDIKEWFTVIVAYVFLLVKILESGIKFLPVFNEKNSAFPPLLDIAKGIVETGFLYIVLKLYPGGIMFVYGVLEGFSSLIEFGHQTLVLASSEMRPHPKWSSFVHQIRSVQYLSLAIHGSYMLFKSDCLAPRDLLFSQVAYGLLSLLILKLQTTNEVANR